MGSLGCRFTSSHLISEDGPCATMAAMASTNLYLGGRGRGTGEN
jgi:hypothetical protein